MNDKVFLKCQPNFTVNTQFKILKKSAQQLIVPRIVTEPTSSSCLVFLVKKQNKLSLNHIFWYGFSVYINDNGKKLVTKQFSNKFPGS
jgi:hypothetical protein